MAEIEPFALLNFEEALNITRQPMVAPEKSLQAARNGRVFRGRLKKRQGYTFFSELGFPVSENLTTPPQGGSGTAVSLPLLPGESSPSTYKVTWTDGTDTLEDDGLGNIDHFGGASGIGLINYLTGVWSWTWPGGAPVGDVTFTYEQLRAKPIMGLDGHFPTSGSEFLLAFDTRGMWKYNIVETRFYKVGADEWVCAEETLADGSLTSADYFWTEVFNEFLVILNGIDAPKVFNHGSNTIVDIDSSWNASGNEIDTALLALKFKGRLILLRTQEGGTNHPQRARWSGVNADLDGPPSAFDVADFVDCPTTDWIVSSSFLGDKLIVMFERSIWELEANEDPRNKFSWKQIAATEGSFAKMSTIDFSNEIITLSAVGLVATDGIDTNDAAESIPDFSLDWNPLKLHYTFGIVNEEFRQVLWTYVPKGLEAPTKLLDMQYEDDAFTTHDLDMLVYGYYTRSDSAVWDDFGLTFDELDFTFDEKTAVAGFPTLLGGKRNSKIYTMFEGPTDDGDDIDFDVQFQKLRPYPLIRSRLHYIDLIAEPTNDPLTIEVFRDYEVDPRKTIIVELSGNVKNDRVHRRIKINMEGAFFSFRLIHNAQSALTIDAFVPYFSATARLRRTGRKMGASA